MCLVCAPVCEALLPVLCCQFYVTKRVPGSDEAYPFLAARYLWISRRPVETRSSSRAPFCDASFFLFFVAAWVSIVFV